MILVASVGGTFGRRVTEMLVDADVPVRALLHGEPSATVPPELPVEVAVVDLDRPETLLRSLRDVEQLLLATPPHPRRARREKALLYAARHAGVARVVKVGDGMRLHGHPLNPGHTEVAAALETSRATWTLLSPRVSMETALLSQAGPLRDTRILRGSAGTRSVALVAADDVVRVAAVVLAEYGHDREELVLTGPEALSFEDVARRLERALGAPVVYQDEPEPDLAEHLVAAGLAEEEVQHEILPSFAAIRHGVANGVTDVVERVTGSPPMSVDDFLAHHADRLH